MNKIDKKKEILKLSSIGARLVYLRGSKSQEYYANIMGVSVPNYCKYEKDQVNPDWRKLKKLAKSHGLTLTDITEGLDDETSNQTEDSN